MCKCRLHNLENESEETAMERRKLTKEDIDKVRNGLLFLFAQIVAKILCFILKQ